MACMRPEDVRSHLRAQPFRPFRIYLSDSAPCDIAHPGYLFVTRREVVIGIQPTGSQQLPERSVYCDPIHITRIEVLENGEPARRPEDAVHAA